MARIKKKGLDYFPLNTDFIHDRAVRRLMKREGDSALGILVEILSYIYAGEGYYVRADRLFYEDLSAGLYEKSADDVERIVRLAVEYGLFDAVLFERSCILTSVEIQRQYLFSTMACIPCSVCPIKRNAHAGIYFSCAVRYCFCGMTFKISRFSTPKSRYSGPLRIIRPI